MQQLITFIAIITVSTSSPLYSGRTSIRNRREVYVNKYAHTDVNNVKEPQNPTYPDFQQYGREEAAPETEHWLSKIDSVYNRAQKAAADYFTPKPLVDVIQEHEKYGNDGGIHRQITMSIIDGYSALGRLGNALLDFPSKAKAELGKNVSAILSAVGSKISGI